jgi:hypothetical protein
LEVRYVQEHDSGAVVPFSPALSGVDGLQHYTEQVDRVLAAAEIAAGGDRSRAMFWFLNEPLQEFDDQTPAALVRAGRAEVVVDYIESTSGGACG